jgi:uncharacterized protein
MQPKNGYYLDRKDFDQWQDTVSPLIESYETLHGIDNKETYKDTKNPDLKVKNITFVVTEKCNLNCSYCYEQHKTGRRMSKSVAKKAIDFLFNKEKINNYYNFKTSPAVIIEFIGGEPLLEIELMDYIVEYFKFKAFELDSPWATNYMISMTTNGVLYDTPKVQKFLAKNAGKVSLGITIDGNKKLHDSCRKFYDGSGSYNIVEKSIKDAVKKGYTNSTKITLSPQNIMYLNEAIQNVWSLGIVGAHTNCVFEKGWQIKDAKIFYKELKKLADYLLADKNYSKYYCSLFDDTIGKELTEDRNWCGGNGSMLAIAPDGRCFPCIRFMKYSLNKQKEQPIGDINRGLDKKEENVWLNKLKDITMSSQCQYEDNKKCLTCKIASGCALCTGYNYDEFGDPNHKATSICDMHKARVLANVYYWNKLKREIPMIDEFKLNLDKKECLRIINENEYISLKKLIKRV